MVWSRKKNVGGQNNEKDIRSNTNKEERWRNAKKNIAERGQRGSEMEEAR